MTGHLIGGRLSDIVLQHAFQSSVYYLFRCLIMLPSFPSQFYGYQLEARKSSFIFQSFSYNRPKFIGIYYHSVRARPVYGILFDASGMSTKK